MEFLSIFGPLFVFFLHISPGSLSFHCILSYIPKQTCYYYDFDAKDCFPWNTTFCPTPAVAHRVKKCPRYECFPVRFFAHCFDTRICIIQYVFPLATRSRENSNPDSFPSAVNSEAVGHLYLGREYRTKNRYQQR